MMPISIKGKPVTVPSVMAENRTIVIRGTILRVARVMDDFLDAQGVQDPDPIILALKKSKKADLFSFLGRFAAATGNEQLPFWHANYHVEYQDLSAIHVISFDHWWAHQIKKQTRRKIRKALEEGITVCQVPPDDQFIEGIVQIFNETPVRQGKKFWHYGKGFPQVKREISTYSDRSTFLGAYFDGNLVGFAKLINCGCFGRANQLLSMVKHRNKPVTNALVAELVRICEKERLSYLIYGGWNEGTLRDFKVNNGFRMLSVPRYYMPLTPRGQFVLKVGLHKGARQLLPNSVRTVIRNLRQAWHKSRLLSS